MIILRKKYINDIENLLKLIDCLNVDDLNLLKNRIDEILLKLNGDNYSVSNYIPSNDVDVIANYLDSFQFDSSKREEKLKRYEE